MSSPSSSRSGGSRGGRRKRRRRRMSGLSITSSISTSNSSSVLPFRTFVLTSFGPVFFLIFLLFVFLLLLPPANSTAATSFDHDRVDLTAADASAAAVPSAVGGAAVTFVGDCSFYGPCQHLCIPIERGGASSSSSVDDDDDEVGIGFHCGCHPGFRLLYNGYSCIPTSPHVETSIAEMPWIDDQKNKWLTGEER